MAKPVQFKIEECTGAMNVGKPFTLSMKGRLLKEPYTTAVVIGSLQELLEENKFWMGIKTEIAGAGDSAGSGLPDDGLAVARCWGSGTIRCAGRKSCRIQHRPESTGRQAQD